MTRMRKAVAFRTVLMSDERYTACKRYMDHAMSCEGGVDGDGKFNLTEVESAIGALLVGQMFGYRVLELTHAGVTRRKYCRLLGIKSFRDVCPETAVYTQRHFLFRVMGSMSDWWRGREALPREHKSRRASVDVS